MLFVVHPRVQYHPLFHLPTPLHVSASLELSQTATQSYCLKRYKVSRRAEACMMDFIRPLPLSPPRVQSHPPFPLPPPLHSSADLANSQEPPSSSFPHVYKVSRRAEAYTIGRVRDFRGRLPYSHLTHLSHPLHRCTCLRTSLFRLQVVHHITFQVAKYEDVQKRAR